MRLCAKAILSATFLLAIGCEKKESVQAYQAPKEPAATQAAPSTLPTSAIPVASVPEKSGRGIEWSAPGGWVEDPQPRPMRVATLMVGSGAGRAELIVTRFRAGGFGSMLDNLNRWRQQVGLEPLKDESAVTPEKTTVAGAEAQVYDFTGPRDQGTAARRNRVAMVQTPAGDVWFFRLTGPADVVEAQRPAFDAFLASVKFAGH